MQSNKVASANKHVHFIGVAGVTMAPLAVLYKNLGWHVTGSDRAFFPPMSTYLEENGIVIMPGFKKEHMDPAPNLVIVMAFITKKNPELIAAIAENIPYKTYSEVLPDLIEKENSVVVVGSRGKTMTVAFMTWLLESVGHSPSFMIGGIPKNFTHGIRASDSSWSVIEGDEYATASWNPKSKFLDYNPRYLILTGVTWDHINIFPTEQEYKNTYVELVKKVPKDGLIIAKRGGENLEEILAHAKAGVVWYEAEEPHFYLAAPRALAKELDIANKHIKKAQETFRGVKRRQEVRYQEGNLVVIDDNAHSPEKVEGVLSIVREKYPNKPIVAIYEPGSRVATALEQTLYATCFKGADYVFLPRISTNSKESKEFNKELAERYGKYYPHMEYVDSDEELVGEIQKTSSKEAIVLFMSQKGFRGMIEEFISRLQSSQM